MIEKAIDGAASLAQITDFVRNIEVAGGRFIGARISERRTICSFVIDRVPAKPTVIAASENPPSQSTIVWKGQMHVSGKPMDVVVIRAERDVSTVPGGLEKQVAVIQQALGVTTDGRAGPETWEALRGAIAPDAVKDEVQRTNARSDKVIATLQPFVRPYARALFFKARIHGIEINIISGTRSFAEQDRLYAQGRTAPGFKVTNAKGGESLHNYGIAFDIGVFEGKNYLGRSPRYNQVGILGLEIGLKWGGVWKKPDRPHFELWPDWAQDSWSTRELIANCRERWPKGYKAQSS